MQALIWSTTTSSVSSLTDSKGGQEDRNDVELAMLGHLTRKDSLR